MFFNDIIMNRGGIVRTVSITSIQRQSNKIEVTYHDLLEESVKEIIVKVL